MNASLPESCIVFEALQSIHVGLLFVQDHAKDRPTMLSVVLMLVSESVISPPKLLEFINKNGMLRSFLVPHRRRE